MMNGRERHRGPPSGEMPAHRDPRRVGDPRNGGFAAPPADSTTLSRAEKFEDEKKRIAQSCFSKKDSDGTLVESYITHVRITEDAAYPSTPPPPNSPPENKKARVIIVAVRRSGRVRVHKARENNDGSFSIGKTWMLDDLSAILSYSAWTPPNPIELQYKQWATNVGFTVTVGKPYYWHARTSKEKEFFIGSLVKIYKKYTGGKVPQLIGFDDRERQLLVGTPPIGPPGSSRGPVPPSIRPEGPPSSHGSRPQSPYTSRASSRDGPREARRAPLEEQSLRAQRSRDHIRRPPTGQSGKVATPPQTHPPVFPADSRDQTPPRSSERFASDEGIPKAPAFPYRDPEETSLASSHFDSQPPPSRDGRSVSETRPFLRTQDSVPSSPDLKRSNDGLRPTTPGSAAGERPNVVQSPASSLGQRSPLENVSIPEPSGRPREIDVPNDPIDSHALRNDTPQPTVEPTLSVSPAEPGPIESAHDISPPAAEPEPEPVEEEPEMHRPGLGPMIKKKQNKDVAGAFRKAATAYGAFRPRPGGAAERLMAAAKKQKGDSDEPDGITGVVPAPSLRTGNEPSTPTLQTPESEMAPPISPAKETPPPASPVMEPPTVEVTQAIAEEPSTPTIEIQEEDPRDTSRSTVKVPVDERSRSASPSPHDRNRRRREDNTIKYCQALGIDSKVLDGHGVDFDDILTDLGWNGRLNDEKRIEDLEADVRREIGRVEATSWLGNLEQQEGKVDQLAKLIEKTVEECDELDGLLTLYSHEMSTLNDDVSYIEAQSQGLQVQTANQKLLQNELQNLLRTLSISPSELRALKEASLSNQNALRDTERALSTLYRAMHMIDSDIWQNKKRLVDAAGQHGSVGVYADTEIGQMRAIKEKKDEYRTESRLFLQRLRQFMGIAYKVAEQKRIDAAAENPKEPIKINGEARDAFRQELWMYNALTLFAREVSSSEWNGLIQLYEHQAKGPYQSEFRDNIQAWKKSSRRLTGEEQELLFTHHDKEKENEGITMAARKLTVKRGKTIKAAAGLRLSSGEKQDGKLDPCEAFAGSLLETLGMICEEQNFLLHFFHLDSLSTVDFPDLVASGSPDKRRCPDFTVKRSHDPDRSMARKVEQIMDELFSFWPTDMQNLVDWTIQADPIQGIGILFALERAMSDLDDTNQDFIIHSLQKVHSRLVGLFNRFVDEQIRGIEDTKVKVNKRKGVISFMRVFPNFSAAVETMLSHPSQEFCDVRLSVNEAYNRINRAMWESLKFIAKEAPGPPVGATTGGGDPEDKEALNYHILLIENMNHYIEEVDVRGLPVLERWCDRAHQDLEEHMKLYLDAVIRRPLGKLLEFVVAAEGLASTSSHPAEVASRPSHTRSVAKKVLATYDTKEIKRGIELLKKRVEKHFGDADDPGLSRNLVLKVFGECERRYEGVHDRTRLLLETVYEGQLEQDWRKEDAVAMFRRV